MWSVDKCQKYIQICIIHMITTYDTLDKFHLKIKQKYKSEKRTSHYKYVPILITLTKYPFLLKLNVI